MDEATTLISRSVLGERTQQAVRRLSEIVRAVVHQPMGAAGLAIILFFTGMAIFAHNLAGDFPNYASGANISVPNLPPSPGYPLGTDSFGRSNYALLVYGAQVSLLVGLAASAVAMVVGTVVGVPAGFYGGWTDRVLSMLTNFFLVIPWLPFVLMLVLVMGRGLSTTIIAIAAVSWPTTARILRSEVLTQKTHGYIVRARAIGASNSRIMTHHLIPVLGPLIFANLVLTVSSAVFVESFLAFFGLEDVSVSSWGTMIQISYVSVDFVRGAWWSVLPPGVCITALVLAFAMLGHVVEPLLNPRLRKR